MTQDRRRGFQGPVITTQRCSRDHVSVEGSATGEGIPSRGRTTVNAGDVRSLGRVALGNGTCSVCSHWPSDTQAAG